MLYTFENAGGLAPVSGNRFVPTTLSSAPQAREAGLQGCGAIKQGYLERANVDLTRELIDVQLVERRANAVRQALSTHGIFTN